MVSSGAVALGKQKITDELIKKGIEVPKVKKRAFFSSQTNKKIRRYLRVLIMEFNERKLKFFYTGHFMLPYYLDEYIVRLKTLMRLRR